MIIINNNNTNNGGSRCVSVGEPNPILQAYAMHVTPDAVSLFSLFLLQHENPIRGLVRMSSTGRKNKNSKICSWGPAGEGAQSPVILELALH